MRQRNLNHPAPRASHAPQHPLLIFLSYFWGPMPIMIWIAAAVELAKASAGFGGWEDFAVRAPPRVRVSARNRARNRCGRFASQ